MKWFFFRDLRSIVRQRHEEPDFDRDQRARQQVIEAVDRFVKKHVLHGLTHENEDLEVRIRHGFSVLPLEDIEVLNRVCFEGRVFESSAHPGVLGMMSLLANIYDVAGARHGETRRWAEMIDAYTAEKNDIDANLAKEAGDRRRDRLTWLCNNLPMLMTAAWCVSLALTDFSDEWVFQLSRWGVCAVCIWRGLALWKQGWRQMLIPLASVAVLFNPLAPIDFEERQWVKVDWIAAGVLTLYIWATRKQQKKKNHTDAPQPLNEPDSLVGDAHESIT